jgi:hypothetical protein
MIGISEVVPSDGSIQCTASKSMNRPLWLSMPRSLVSDPGADPKREVGPVWPTPTRVPAYQSISARPRS